MTSQAGEASLSPLRDSAFNASRTSILSTTSSNGTRRKSFTQSIRSRFSRQSSTHSSTPVPPIPSSSILSPPTVKDDDMELAWASIVPPAFPNPLQYAACYCEENVYLLLAYLSSTLALVNGAALKIARTRIKAKKSTRPVSPHQAIFVPVWDLHGIFISNPTKTVLLYGQNASKLPNAGSPVIWDYHVIAAATCTLIPLSELALNIRDGSIKRPENDKRRSRSWVYDSDSNLSAGGKVVRWEEYLKGTFREEGIPQHFQPQFRVVGAREFGERFSSDRSHMRVEGGGWSAAPPRWEMIVGEEARKMGVTNNLMHRYVNMDATEGEDGYGRVYGLEDVLGSSALPGPMQDIGLGATVKDTEENAKIVSRARASVPMAASISMPTLAPPPVLPPPLTRSRSDVPLEKKSEAVVPKGGRIVSPLFPAYLHASQEHRSRHPPHPPTPPAHTSQITQ